MPPVRRSRWRALAAAILCPFTFLLSIGSLTESWQRNPGTRDSLSKAHDSSTTIAAQSILFILHFAASTALIIRFLSAEILISTTITLVVLCISIVLSVVSLTLFGLHHRPLENVSSTFWLEVASCCIACVVVVLLLWEIARTLFYKIPRCRITVKQRALIMTFYLFVVYLSIFSVMFKFASKLLYLDAMYFLFVTVITAGFGDLSPSTPGTQIATIIVTPVGIVLVGILISQIRETVLAAARSKFLEKLDEKAHQFHDKVESDLGIGHGHQERQFDDEDEDNSLEALMKEGLSYEESLRKTVMGMEKSSRSTYIHELLFAVSLLVLFWTIGALAFSHLEGHGYGTAIYFSFVAFSTIGYGDISPKTSGGRAFYIPWGMMGFFCLTLLFSVIGDVGLDGMRSNLRTFLSKRLGLSLGGPTEKDHPRRPSSSSSPHSSSSSSPSHPSSSPPTEEPPPDPHLLIRDVRQHVRALLRRDQPDMRLRLQKLFVNPHSELEGAAEEAVREEGREQGKKGEEEGGRLGEALLDEDDDVVTLLLLKHCDEQLSKVQKHLDATQPQRQRQTETRTS